MPIDFSVLDAMVEAGADGKTVLAAMKKLVAQDVARRKKVAARKRRSRASRKVTECPVTRRDVTPVDQPVECSPSAPTPDVVGTEPAILIDRKIDRSATPREVASRATDVAERCRRETGAAKGSYRDLELQAEAWLERGYQPTQIVAGFVQMVARYGHGKPIGYIDKAVTTACTRAPPAKQRELPLFTPHQGGKKQPKDFDANAYAKSWDERSRQQLAERATDDARRYPRRVNGTGQPPHG